MRFSNGLTWEMLLFLNWLKAFVPTIAKSLCVHSSVMSSKRKILWADVEGAFNKKRRLQLVTTDGGTFVCPVAHCENDGFSSKRGCRKHVSKHHGWYYFFDEPPHAIQDNDRYSKQLLASNPSKSITANLPSVSKDSQFAKEFITWMSSPSGGGRNQNYAEQITSKILKFLAFCFEYRDFANTDFDNSFITTLPIQSDCSNSGLQHYSAMMRDEIGGKATNLIPSNKPNDVYGLVAQKLTMKLRDNPNPMAKLWLDYGINRKLCKKPVMCLPYSLTMFSCRRYIHDHVEKQLKEKNKPHEFGDDLFKASNFLTPIMWQCINEIILGARKIMKFLKDIAKLVASENLPVTWTTPLGLPVQMMCYKKESKRVKTKMGDSIIKLSIQSDTDVIDRKKTAQSICPNFCHSLDASLLQLAVVKAHKEGVTNFSLIHDSFGSVAPDTAIMSKAIREAFCEIYKTDVLLNFAVEMKAMCSSKNQAKFPNIPEKGMLDLNLVKQSVFFCV